MAQANATVAQDAAKVNSDGTSGASAAQTTADQANLNAANGALATAQANLADASLTSPIAGTVSVVNLTVGQQLGNSGGSGNNLQGTGTGSGLSAASSSSNSSASGNSSTPQVEVVSTGFVVNLSVDDTQIGRLQAGQSATISASTASAGTGTGRTGRAGGGAAAATGAAGTAGTAVFHGAAAGGAVGGGGGFAGFGQGATGTVTSVGTVATSTDGVASFPVTVTVTGTPTGLYSGSTVEVAITYRETDNVLEVPTAAITTKGGQSTVTVSVNGATSTKQITTGQSSGAETQVLSGLSAGDQVVVTVHVITAPSGSTTGARARPAPAVSEDSVAGGAGGGGFVGRGGFGGGGVGERGRGSGGMTDVDAALGPVIRLEAVTKVYKSGSLEVAALIDVDLTIEQGEFVAVVGPSGSGKSTLMHILGCLDVPTRGTYRLAGEDVSTLSENELADIRNERIGFVFQQFNLLPSLTAARNVELPLAYAGYSRAERRVLAADALGRVGLGDRMQHRPGELSGGQQQRVAVARALVTEPALILADEPTGNLDSTATADMLGLFQELHRAGRTIVLITHEPSVAAIAGRTVHFLDGRIALAHRSASEAVAV